ncbi:MAG: ABC transporter ATP-binding protein [Rectinema sp.]|nr:ABC transporter ATP-binding protein [Rectinema sp.]
MNESEFSSRSADVALINLTKKFNSLDGSGEITAVDNLSLQIKTGELVTILGPSGCGKTTTLRMIAGFEYPTSGSILIGGRDVALIPPNKRGLSMVFQSYALFPHLTIYENVAYGLRVHKLPEAEIERRTRSALELMQLMPMAKRFPAQVSGGQQQRIALARAIVIEPSVLLFDEPLSNLDAKLREYMRDELRKLQKRLGITSLYVTHDQSEAMAISDRIVIMKDGKIQQVGSPRDIYAWPRSRFVADFMGKANFLEVRVLGYEGDAAHIEVERTAGLRLRIPNPGETAPREGKALLVVRPEMMSLVALDSARVEGRDGSEASILKGRVERLTYFGNIARYEIATDCAPIMVERYNPEGSRLFSEGSAIGILIDVASVRLLPDMEEVVSS